MGASNLRLRVLSALVMAPVVIGLTWLGGIAFWFMVVAVSLIIFSEWTGMFVEASPPIWRRMVGGLLAIVLLALLIAGPSLVMLAVIIGIYALLSLISVSSQARGRRFGQPLAFGFLYGALPAQAFLFLREYEAWGARLIFLLYLVVWGTDIFAYVVGKNVGGPKLAPRISPAKTWSGAIGGALIAAVAGLGYLIVYYPPSELGFDYGATLLMLVMLSAVSQAGDLFESKAKRRAGVKDSSHIIPGHGGVLDRVDGLVAAAVCLYAVGLIGQIA